VLKPIDMPSHSWTRADGYCLSTDRARLDLDVVERFLRDDAYWSAGLSRATLERALAGSLPMGLYAPDGSMAGFARLVTDYAVFAYLRDVFVLPAHRGRGLAGWLARGIRAHPELASVTSWLLATRDAHAVYARAGYAPVAHPEWYMNLPRQDP